ncbi:MAG: bifunctional response regulator/alkaline phosphatase family protein [bacterium]
MTRLLWIDDEIDLLRPFIYGLRERGYEVATASNGPDGLDLLGSGSYDLILLDQMMAGMTGLEVLRRAKERAPNVLVAMITKSDEEALIDEAYGDLVDDFLIKPFTPAQLLAVLKRLLDKRRLVGERIGRQYLAAVGPGDPPRDWPGWVERYRLLVSWQEKLGRYGDSALAEIQEERWREENEEFGRFVEQGYRSWLGGGGPVLSHRVMTEHVLPHCDERPTCLLILDAMRTDQWLAIEPELREFCSVETGHYCSVLPSATPYSRNAMLSGLLPLDIRRRYPDRWVFEESGQNRYEEELLTEHLRRVGFGHRFAYHRAGSGEELERVRGLLLDREVRLSVLIVNFLDLLIHSVKANRVLDEIVANDPALVAMTRVWFRASPLASIIRALVRRDRTVVVTSDHGFIRVRRPTEIHGGRKMSANLRYKHGGAIRVDDRHALLIRDPAEYRLPVDAETSIFAIARSDYYFIYPTKPREYERTYKNTYQHGGISLPEMVVPVATLRQK